VPQLGSTVQTGRRTGEFEAEVEWHDATFVVRVQGALDFYSAEEARRLLLDQLERRPGRVVVDVRDAFVDSCGIGVLIHVAQRVKMERGEFRLLCDLRLAEVLSFHRVDALLGVRSTPDQRTRDARQRQRQRQRTITERAARRRLRPAA